MLFDYLFQKRSIYYLKKTKIINKKSRFYEIYNIENNNKKIKF